MIFKKNISNILVLVFIFILLPIQKTNAALPCVGQWPGSTVDITVKRGNSSGPVILSRHFDDPGSTGSSGGSDTISVNSGDVLYFEGTALAPDQNADSWWSVPYFPASHFLEGRFSVLRTGTSNPITSNTFFNWSIDAVCNDNGTLDPSWDGGTFNYYLGINVNPAPTDGICGTANKTYPTGSTSYGADNYCAAGTPSISPAFPAAGTSASWVCNGINGGSDSPICTATNPGTARYRCSGAGTCIRDDVSGNTTSPTCNNSCVIPPNPVADLLINDGWANGANLNGPIWVYYGIPTVTLSWTSNASSCTVTSSPNVGSWSGPSGTTVSVPALTALSTTFSINCNNGATDAPIVVNIPPPPTGLVTSCAAPGSTVNVSWTNAPGYNTAYFRANVGANNPTWPSLVMQPEQNPGWTGNSTSYASTPGQTYYNMVFTRQPVFPFAYSSAIAGNITCATAFTPPTNTSITISGAPYRNDGTSTYTIREVVSEPTGGTDVSNVYALINYELSDNGSDGHTSTDRRGLLVFLNIDTSWPGWSDYKDVVSCGAGTSAGIHNNPASLHGGQYIDLVSCSTSVSGTVRTVNFVVRFNTNYTSPITNNDISGEACSAFDPARCNALHRFDTDFQIEPPTLNNVSISSSSVNPDGVTPYTITIDADDYAGGGNLSWMYALINYDLNINGSGSHTPSDYRGLLTWSLSDPWPTYQDHQDCTGNGGGHAVIQNIAPNDVYGHTYINLLSCRSVVSGNNRSVDFIVSFNPSFTTPTTGNDISGFVANEQQNRLNYPSWVWTWFDTNFSLAAVSSVPVLGSPTDTSITTSGATLGATLISAGSPATIIARGTCWGTTPAPVTNCLAEGGTTTGVFSHVRSGMSASTLYYYRGYATNGTGTGYSSDGTFTTSANPVDGVCGSKAGGPSSTSRTYPTSATAWDVGDTYCSIGNPSSSPAFPGVGNSVSWQCLGTNGGFSPSCTASHDNSYSVSVTVNTTSGGTVTSMPAGISCGGTCSTTFPQDSVVTLVPTPSSSYWRFAGWGGDCSGTGACILTINSTKTVTATFAPRSFRYIEF